MKNRELSNSITSIRLEDMSLKGIMKDLFDQKIRSVLVEGGGELLRNCLDTSQWDEARVFCSTESFGNGIVAPCIPGSPDQKTNISQDRLLIYKNETQWPKN